jgi:hypothetical protein
VQVSVKIASTGKRGGFDIGVQTCQRLNQTYKDMKGDYSYDVSIREFNCGTHEERTISTTYYDEKGNILCMDSTGSELHKIDLNDKNYLPTLVYQAVCK